MWLNIPGFCKSFFIQTKYIEKSVYRFTVEFPEMLMVSQNAIKLCKTCGLLCLGLF